MSAATVFALILPWVVVSAGCWIGYQLIRQNGRILLRLDTLERHLETLKSSWQDAVPVLAAAPSPTPGLPLGSPAPLFELPDLSGVPHGLAEWRGTRVLLVFFNPQCGYCTQMGADLATLPIDGRNGAPIPLVITTGDASANRELVTQYGIRGPVLLQKQMEIASTYLAGGTPMGYLLDEQGRIASAMAVGAQALLQLAPVPAATPPSATRQHRGNRSLSESKIERQGLIAGTPAPGFRLPRLDGGELSIEQYRGQRVLLVFSDPHCGPCDLLAPQLEQIHRQRPDLQVLMVSRGDAEENRQKIRQQGLTFPVVLQSQWEISRLYGMFATPIAYFIDQDGVIVEDVASGADAILAVANRQIADKELVRQ